MSSQLSRLLTQRARELRRTQTDAELALWRALRDRRFAHYKFRRQRPVGPYIPDFVCMERMLIVEVDGAQHAERMRYDRARDEFLRSQGFRVLRFSNREVLTELESVASAILLALEDGAVG